MDLQAAIRYLRLEKQWYDDVIASLDKLRRSRKFQARAQLQKHVTGAGQAEQQLSPAQRRRLQRMLRRK